MPYLTFSLWFTVLHIVAYMLAGALALKVSQEIYEGRQRRMTYLRDMADPEDKGMVQKRLFPAQILRGLLLSIVLYPILGPLGELAFGLRFAFLAGLMFVYTHVACAAPCSDNVEGYVYLRPQFFSSSTFWKFQMEMAIYSLVFSLPAAWLLF